jgi:hypothetical protein
MMRIVDDYFEKKYVEYETAKIEKQNYFAMKYILNADDVIGKDRKKISGMRKRDFIRWYYGVSKSILKNKNFLEKIKNEIIERKSQNYTNDEIIFDNYTVTGVFLPANEFSYINDISEKVQQIEQFKLKFKGLIDEKDISKIDLNKNKSADNFAYPIEDLRK